MPFKELSNQKDISFIRVYKNGRVKLSSVSLAADIDISSIQAECSEKIIPGSECYELFKAMGVECGPGHQGIESIYAGKDKVLTRLLLPSSVSDTEEQYILHPSIMDGALQVTIGLAMGNGQAKAANGDNGKLATSPAAPQLHPLGKRTGEAAPDSVTGKRIKSDGDDGGKANVHHCLVSRADPFGVQKTPIAAD